MRVNKQISRVVMPVAAVIAAAVGGGEALAVEAGGTDCEAIAGLVGTSVHAALSAALASGVSPPVGLGNNMWATVVDRNGIVCAVTYSGGAVQSQWLGSRVISAQKANTAHAFSLPAGAGGAVPGLALSTANLWAATQPGGSLFGLQASNPVDPAVAYGDNAGPDGSDTNAAPPYGMPHDPLVGKFIGGVNVFGGGLALYAEGGMLVGAIGVSGDTSCADHVVAWRTRDALGLDSAPAGVSPTGDDNIIFDVKPTNPGKSGFESHVSEGGFGHPDCGFGERALAEALPESHPID